MRAGTVYTNAKHNLRDLAAAISATQSVPSIVTLLTVLQNMDHQHVLTRGLQHSSVSWRIRCLALRGAKGASSVGQVYWLGPEGLCSEFVLSVDRSGKVSSSLLDALSRL